MLGDDGTEVMLGERAGGKKERKKEEKKQTEWRGKVGDVGKLEARWARALIVYRLIIS